MRFVSRSANFSAGNFRNAKEGMAQPETRIIDGKTVTSVSGTYTLIPSVPINFNQYGLTQADISAAQAQWTKFPGLPQEEDEVTPANPLEHGFFGSWDSVEWQKQHGLTDDEREQGEQMLLNSDYFGHEFIAIEAMKAPKPWPSYDDTHHSKVASLAAELGLVPEALAYEQENKKRASVVGQLEAALPTESGEFVVA